MMEHAILISEIDIKVTLENKNISNFISNMFSHLLVLELFCSHESIIYHVPTFTRYNKQIQFFKCNHKKYISSVNYFNRVKLA